MYSDRNAAPKLMSFPSRQSLAFALAATSAALFLTACGSNYRPVVSSINPVGPASQPTKYAVVISSTGATTPGLATIVDFSGDTILDTTRIGAAPFWLTLDTNGADGYVLNRDGTVNSFGISISLIQSQVNQSTLPANSNASTIISQGASLYVTQPGLNSVAQLQGVPPALKQELPTGATPVYTIAASGAPRVYTILQNGASAGTVAAIETTTQTISASLPVGVNPVYGVMSSDTRRAYVLNQGSNTVTVINAQKNAVDSSSTLPTGTISVGTAPVWADISPVLNELFVANQGDGTHPGSLSIINIPLCNSSTVVTNPECDTNNPVDAVGFGQTVATIPVGVNPIQVQVLSDGSQAYVANAGNPGAGIAGSITVINLATNTVVATIPCTPSNANDGLPDATIHGNPSYIAVTTGLPTGRVYVVSSQSHDLSILRTDIDAVLTHLPLLSTGVMVHVTAQ